MPDRVEIIGLPGVPMVQPGDDLGALVISALVDAAIAPEPDDVLVIAQKIVSKAENRFVDVGKVHPSPEAHKLAEETEKDARF
jgi:coenzyme F420-0:L-glutamate ligase / coenzyme F420-1:gamma-L-glutamate ligase